MIEYEDFSLKIEPKRGNLYPVVVLRSPAGEGRSSLKLPFDPDEIGSILFNLGLTVRGSSRVPLREVSPAATRTRPQQIGDQLFNALFSGPVRSLFDRSLGMIHGRQRGLRINLHIDPEDPGLAQLASLPWEFLYRKETRDFLNLSRFTPILRYLDVQRPYTPLPLEPPLRILVVISDPADYDRLDLDRERALVEASWAKQKGVEVEFMEAATIFDLQDRLTSQPYHVLHYMGHGGFEERTGRGVLVMEDEDGQGSIVDGSTLGVLLRDLPTMRLVFLNACETARVTKEMGADPFAGVASAMVMAGIPAVVAMQFPVSDSAAITFSQKFYPLLARGNPVDAAVAEGRQAVRIAEPNTMEWGTPVLFLRAPQGVIFQVSEAHREKVSPSQIPELPEEVDEELEQRLAELYTRGLSAFWLEEWEKAARSFQAIVEVNSNYEDVIDKLSEANRQANLQALYIQAQTAQKAEDWSSALAALEELGEEAVDYKDTAERLQTVRKQKQLSDLYEEARHLHQAQQWQAVVNVFGQIFAIEADYADPEELLNTAEREVVEQKRQAKLNDLYSHAVREVDSMSWNKAHQLLTQVQRIEPGFQDTERLLAMVEQEIEREKTERQQQEQIAMLYNQVLEMVKDRQWRQVLSKMEEIQILDPEFSDIEGIAKKAREEVRKEEEEARRQSELAAIYAETVRLLKTEQYQEVLEKWGEIQARNPHFPDHQNVQSQARKRLERLARDTAPRKRLPVLKIAAIVSLILAGVMVIIYFMGLIRNFPSDTSRDGAAVPIGFGEIVKRIQDRGSVVCGSRTDLAGFGELDANGRNVGFDIDLCRAIAAALLDDPEAVEFVPLSAAERGPALQTGEVDILSRNATWTTTRDALWGNFTSVWLYDGQGFMVPVASGITDIEQLDGATVCVTSGTTTELNLADAFRQRGLDYTAVTFEDTATVYSTYEEGRCDATTSDRYQLSIVRDGLANPDAHLILDITISKEPLTPAVPSGDDQWFDIVKVVVWGLINAEELGVTQSNVEEMKSSDDVNVRRLLGSEGEWGQADLGLPANAIAKAVTAVGNYGEIYERYFGPNGLNIPRGLNELWTNGGLIYAPPMR